LEEVEIVDTVVGVQDNLEDIGDIAQVHLQAKGHAVGDMGRVQEAGLVAS
jgi:hypothetical protein